MGKTSTAVLCPVLGIKIKKEKKRYVRTGECPEDDNENDRKNLGTKTETTEFAQLWEDEDMCSRM